MITYARLQHFRSYDDGSFEFDPSVNIIVGPNASGKTTLMEAVLVALSGKSFKARDVELLQKEADWARVDVGLTDSVRVCKLVRGGDTAQKTFEIDGRVYKQLRMQHTLPSVLFEPNHLQLLHGSPELRRSFLDDLLAAIRPLYAGYLRQYKRVLAQRNALLKQPHGVTPDQLFVWNLRLSELGGKIVHERVALIAEFNEAASDLYSTVSGTPTRIELVYRPTVASDQYETGVLRALERDLHRDQARGFTGVGPHREDMEVRLHDQVAAETASRGEVRTLVLVLKMLEAQFVETARGVRPVLLFDDVFSELDGRRRQALVQFLRPYQTLITTTDADVVVEHFTDKTHIIAL